MVVRASEATLATPENIKHLGKKELKEKNICLFRKK